MVPTQEKLLESISRQIADYREGEIPPRTPEIINEWVGQFPENLHMPLLEALDDVLSKTYISRVDFKTFLTHLASNDKLSRGTNVKDYWHRANFLRIQQGGNSQKEILDLFEEVLFDCHGFRLDATGSKDGDFIYLDDCIGTGNRLRFDLCAWLESDAPQESVVQVITPVLYEGAYWIDSRIQKTATANGKTISMKKWRLDGYMLENRKKFRNRSDVLWPTAIPDDPDVQAYAEHLCERGYPAVLRKPGCEGLKNLYKDDAQKMLLEQAFLVRGCQIRRECASLPEPVRPLGFNNLDSLGFGSMVVTYRNCPNNCPIAFWAQQDKYPALLPRKTNTQTFGEQLMKDLFG